MKEKPGSMAPVHVLLDVRWPVNIGMPNLHDIHGIKIYTFVRLIV